MLVVVALTAGLFAGCEPNPSGSRAAPGIEGPAASAFAIGAELPTLEEVTAAVAASVNVPAWPDGPVLGQRPWNVDACVGGKDAPTASKSCVYGDPSGKKVTVLYGDSHAAMWGPPIGIIAEGLDWRVEQLTLRSCPAEEFPVYSNELKRHYTECDKHRDDALLTIADLHPDIVFISSQYRGIVAEKDNQPDMAGNDPAWAAGLATTIERLTPMARRVVYLGDIGYSEQQPVDCLSSSLDDARKCNTDRSYAVLAAHNDATREAVETAGQAYVDPIAWQCTESVCPAVVGGMPVWRDRAHLTAEYVLWLRGVLAAAVGFQP